jgi:hypothetical protein
MAHGVLEHPVWSPLRIFLNPLEKATR